MNTIPSPYNFVALPEKVAKPSWSDFDLCDLPFENGLSGWIDFEIIATTPIYVRAEGDFKSYRQSRLAQDCEKLWNRAGRQQNDSRDHYLDDPEFEQFRRFVRFYTTPDGRYAIPGTSIKGMIRLLTEIVTGSRIQPLSRRNYAVRDLRNRPLYSGWMAKGDKVNGFEPTVHSAWLEKRDEQYWIIPCDFARVEQTDLEALSKSKPLPYLGAEAEANAKYTKWEAQDKLEQKFDINPKTKHTKHSLPLIYSKAMPNPNGSTKGTIVFTGQPQERGRPKRIPKRKHMEFIFHSERPKGSCKLEKEQFQAFEEAHSDELGEPSEAWRFWKARMKKGCRVPIFYLAHRNGAPKANTPTVPIDTSGAILHSFGLAMMYRLPYKNKLHQAVPPDHRLDLEENMKPDFAETLFGYQRSTPSNAGLRGRISFDHAICPKDSEREPIPAAITTLGAPKPTYYPNYITQNSVKEPATGRLSQIGGYNTLMDDDPRIRGWKFYPARQDASNLPECPLPPQCEKNKPPSFATATAFEALPAGTLFKGRMRFHNLRPEEIGALIWVLTWGGHQNCRHRIGMAKPLGFGCARIKLIGHHFVSNQRNAPLPSIEELQKEFETWSRRECPGWLDGPEIQKDFLGMARHDHGRDSTLQYPRLSMGGTNDFTYLKGSFRDGDPSHSLPLWRDIGKSLRVPKPKASHQPAPATPPPTHKPLPKREYPVVIVEVLELKRRKGKPPIWKGKIVDGRPVQQGSIVGKLPPDICVGNTYQMFLKGTDANNHQFEWVGDQKPKPTPDA
jgi:CRISPR-associated protein (TIGR03986 family)